MNKTSIHAAAAALCIGFAGTTHAVPMYFDFTGTISGGSGSPVEGAVPGQVVDAGFTFELDRLALGSAPLNPEITPYFDYQPSTLTEPLAFLRFGDREITLPIHGELNFNLLSFSDSCTPEGCTRGDSLLLQTRSSDLTPEEQNAGFTGTYRASNFMFLALGDPGQDWFDAHMLDPTTLVDMPLGGLILASYSEALFSCELGLCGSTEERSFSINVTSVSRGIGPRTPVPEPGALAMLSAGLLGFAMFRRLSTRKP